MFAPDTVVVVDFPGHLLHGKRCAVVAFEDGAIGPLVTVTHPSLADRIGLHPAHIAGTVECLRRQREDAAADPRQGALPL